MADKATFVAACDAYYRDVCGDPLPDRDPVTVIDHIHAWITPETEFPHGEHEVRFHEGQVPITIWTQP